MGGTHHGPITLRLKSGRVLLPVERTTFSCGRRSVRRLDWAFNSQKLGPKVPILYPLYPKLSVPNVEGSWLNTVNIKEKNDGGPVAQLGEHLVCNQGVRGSSPLRSTKISL